MSKTDNKIQSPLKKAKGLGSSHHGTHHLIAHDITTITNIPLVLWIIYSIFSLRDANYEQVIEWMAHPFSVIAATLFVISTFYHFVLELQVVYEDYISCKCLRIIKVIGMKLLFFILSLATIFSILKIAFTAGA